MYLSRWFVSFAFLSTNRAFSLVNSEFIVLLFFLQLRVYKTPDLETPKYQILKRTANYEVTYLPAS